jgi:hypothetical protein
VVAQRRPNVAVGLILILLGAWFLAVELVPGLQPWLGLQAAWPLVIIGIGLLFLLFAIFARVPGLAVPGCIVGGIGGLLYWQNATRNWESWAYPWTLIPGFVGLGIILMALLGRETRGAFTGGAWLILISLVAFGIFGSAFGGLTILGSFWPVLLIALGLVLLVRSFIRYR